MNTPRSTPRPRYDFHSAIEKAKKLSGPSGTYRAGVWDPEHSSALGVVVTSWSHLEEKFLYIFHSICRGTNQRVSRIVFRSLVQDSRIRISRYILENSPTHYAASTELDDIIDEFDSCNSVRNKFVHGMWYTHDSGRIYLSPANEDPTLPGTHRRLVPLKEITDLITRMVELQRRISRRQFADLMLSAKASQPSPENPPSAA